MKGIKNLPVRHIQSAAHGRSDRAAWQLFQDIVGGALIPYLEEDPLADQVDQVAAQSLGMDIRAQFLVLVGGNAGMAGKVIEGELLAGVEIKVLILT